MNVDPPEMIKPLNTCFKLKLDSGSIKTSPRDGLRAIGGINTLDYSGLLCLFLGYSETWDTLLILRGTKVIYLDYVGTLRPSKSYLWGGRVVAHKILETAQSPDLGLRTWTQACH